MKMKKIVRITVLALVVLYCWRNTSLPSYVATLWSQTKKEAQAQVPTSFKIDHIQQLIDGTDGEVSDMIRLFSEQKVGVKNLRKKVQATQKRLDDQKEEMRQIARELDDNTKVFVYNGMEYSAEQMRATLQSDFEICQGLERDLKSQKEQLASDEVSLKATEEQLAGIIAKQEEYRRRLDRLKTDNRNLQMTRLANPLPRDNTQSARIEAGFDEVERDLDVQREVIAKTREAFSRNKAPAPPRKQAAADAANIRAYLEGQPALAAGSKVSKN